MTKGLRLGMRTGLHDAWKKTGKPVVSQLAQLPFRNEAADLISSLWQRGATLQKSCLGGVPGAYAVWMHSALVDPSAQVSRLVCTLTKLKPDGERRVSAATQARRQRRTASRRPRCRMRPSMRPSWDLRPPQHWTWRQQR